MKKNVIIIGTGGHGKVIADIISASGDNVMGFLDDDKNKKTIGEVADWTNFSDAEFVIGVGDNDIRERIAKQMDGAKWYVAIHPSAVISESAKIGEGTVIMPNAVVNAEAKIGAHCIVNSGAIVEHENKIEDFCHISVGSKLSGNVTVGKRTIVGIGTSVRNNTSICANCIIGAGAVVVKNITEPGTYIGVPARKK